MLMASQLGVVPLEVKQQLEASTKLLDKIRATWPVAQVKYKTDFVKQVVHITNHIISRLEMKVAALASDPTAAQSDPLMASTKSLLSFIQGAHPVLAAFVAKTAHEDEVELPNFRADIPNVLQGALTGWRQLGGAHDVFLGWMDGVTALEIRDDFHALLRIVEESPHANKQLGIIAKVAIGSVAAAIIGAGVFFAVRQRHSVLQEPQEDEDVPTGIHVFGPPKEAADESGKMEVLDKMGTVVAVMNSLRGKK